MKKLLLGLGLSFSALSSINNSLVGMWSFKINSPLVNHITVNLKKDGTYLILREYKKQSMVSREIGTYKIVKGKLHVRPKRVSQCGSHEQKIGEGHGLRLINNELKYQMHAQGLYINAKAKKIDQKIIERFRKLRPCV